MAKRKRKDPAAVALGRKGGKKRAQGMTKQERIDSARHAINVRWQKVAAERTRKKGAA
jgi:hypothetical protein